MANITGNISDLLLPIICTTEEEPLVMFRMVDTSIKPALGYMEIVPCRDASTLLSIIQTHTTIIHCNQWSAYSYLVLIRTYIVLACEMCKPVMDMLVGFCENVHFGARSCDLPTRIRDCGLDAEEAPPSRPCS